jgi:pyrimidine-nucleoside phosphorylase
MDARRIIMKKRDGDELSPAEIEFMVLGFVRGAVADYQMSSWLMAVLLRGMSGAETHELTAAMLRSGRVVRPQDLPTLSADKHSTGGVGDKVSLALAPLVASAGVCVPMLSGRGLGHTGGTLDKIESLRGLRTDLNYDGFIEQVRRVGCCIASQSDEINPADGRIYALRDVTGTVESIPLIVSSIVSKKVAEGAASLVFDVKWGAGAFIRELDDAVDLALRLVQESERFDRRAMAFVTDMSQPLGNAVGNALELIESVELLRGHGPADLEAVTLLLGAAMLFLSGKAGSVEEGRALLEEKVESGAALDKMKELVDAQGGDPAAIDDVSLIDVCPEAVDVLCGTEGYVRSIDARELGFLVCEMGGGRLRAGDELDRGVGAVLLKKVGDGVRRDEPLARLHFAERSPAGEIARRATSLFEISPSPPPPRPLVPIVVTSSGPRPWDDEEGVPGGS